MDCLTALAALPTLLHDVREAKMNGDLQLLSSSLFPRAQEFKARLSQHALKLHLDFMNTNIVWEKPCTSSGTNPTMLEFCEPQVAFRFNFYWATTIIANTLLLGLGEDDDSIFQESDDAAEDICRSMEHLHSLKPLGALWLTFVASMAYGVSGDANRQRIVDAMDGAYDPIPVKIGSNALQIIFYILTGGIRKFG